MKAFLRENWLWIVTPIVLVLVLVVVVAFVFHDGDLGNFVYPLF
jgi:uncharacterized membrane protein